MFRCFGSCKSLCGTAAYVPPEMVRGEVQGFGVDWWQLGVLLYHRECLPVYMVEEISALCVAPCPKANHCSTWVKSTSN